MKLRQSEKKVCATLDSALASETLRAQAPKEKRWCGFIRAENSVLQRALYKSKKITDGKYLQILYHKKFNIHCWGLWKILQSLWKITLQFLKVLNIAWSCDSAIPLLHTHPSEIKTCPNKILYMKAHSTIIQNS